MILALAITSTIAAAATATAPIAAKKPVVNEYQGVKVTDDYQWLEANDDAAVKAWSDGQNAHARSVIDALPHVADIKARVDTLIRSNSIAYYGLTWRGGVLFAIKEGQAPAADVGRAQGRQRSKE
jgi:prolyl oligopeptidase